MVYYTIGSVLIKVNNEDVTQELLAILVTEEIEAIVMLPRRAPVPPDYAVGEFPGYMATVFLF